MHSGGCTITEAEMSTHCMINNNQLSFFERKCYFRYCENVQNREEKIDANTKGKRIETIPSEISLYF